MHKYIVTCSSEDGTSYRVTCYADYPAQAVEKLVESFGRYSINSKVLSVYEQVAVRENDFIRYIR